MLFWPGWMAMGPYLNVRCSTPGCATRDISVACASGAALAVRTLLEVRSDCFEVEGAADFVFDVDVDAQPATRAAVQPIATSHRTVRRRPCTPRPLPSLMAVS